MLEVTRALVWYSSDFSDDFNATPFLLSVLYVVLSSTVEAFSTSFLIASGNIPSSVSLIVVASVSVNVSIFFWIILLIFNVNFIIIFDKIIYKKFIYFFLKKLSRNTSIFNFTYTTL